MILILNLGTQCGLCAFQVAIPVFKHESQDFRIDSELHFDGESLFAGRGEDRPWNFDPRF